MIDLWSHPETWISLLTLAALEIVLGIDNIVFISILSSKLPKGQRSRARKTGLAFALLTRLGLLFSISWVMGLKEILFSFAGFDFSGRSFVTLGGGLFLLGKATMEIFEALEVPHEEDDIPKGARTFALLIVQIMLLDVVFSLDSVITAVGMVEHLQIMVIAMIIAVAIMLWFADPIGDFVTNHPSMKILALSFLILVGVMLVAESFGRHIPKGYIYFSMAFSLGVELINMKVRKRREPLELHGPAESVD
jgi:predicted tellurium resistance membrane protein TerC